MSTLNRFRIDSDYDYYEVDADQRTASPIHKVDHGIFGKVNPIPLKLVTIFWQTQAVLPVFQA